MSIDPVAVALRSAKRVAVLTGAGISAESGLRTFRGNERDMDSLWKSFDPMTLATPEAFNADPETVTRWYDWRRQGCLAAEPNAGHLALVRIEQRLTGAADGTPEPARHSAFTLLTQNVDRLHQKAGSRNVVELHGSIVEWRCACCGRKHIPPPPSVRGFPAAVAHVQRTTAPARRGLVRRGPSREGPPRGAGRGGILRPVLLHRHKRGRLPRGRVHPGRRRARRGHG